MKERFGRKKFISILAAILIVAIVAFEGYFVYKAISETKKEEVIEEKKEEKITPLLFIVTKEGSNNKMYLFGSIHFANKKDLNFPEYVMNAYNNSNYLACEFDIVEYMNDNTRVINDAMNMLYDDNTTIKDHLSEETYTKLVSFLKKKKVYNELYENYKLSFFDSLLVSLLANDAKISTDHGVDEYFLKKAKEDKKEILELESYEYQMNIQNAFSDELYELMIEQTIDNYEESIDKLKELYEAWKSGNEKELLKYGSDDIEILDQYTEEQKKEIEDYNKKLLDDRNDEMLNNAIKYFNENKTVFFMVGSLHIVGDNGLVNGLRNNGFIVKQVK